MTTFIPRVFGGTIIQQQHSTPPIVVSGGGGQIASPNSQQPYTVNIDGMAVFVEQGTLTIDRTIGKRSQASFTVFSDTSTHFEQYQQVEILDGLGNLAFSGYLSQPKESKPGWKNYLEHQCTCIDQHFLADKRRVAASYVEKTCGTIVQDIYNQILSQEGVTVGLIYDGITPSTTLYPSPSLAPGGNVGLVPSATFVYCTVAQAFDALVKQASNSGVPYYWQIDEYKRLWFCPYTTVTNPIIVDGTIADDGTRSGTVPTVQRQNPTYRNTQYILGGVTQTVPQVETRIGDNNVTAWTMGYQLSTAPTITVNGVTKTVGTKGSTGYGFYWAQGDSVITQDSKQAKLQSTDTLQVSYVGQYPTVISAQNGGQIAYEQALDGSTGIIEDAIIDATLTSATTGQNEASQLLNRYARQGTQLVFKTLTTGFAQGQLVTVNLPMHNLSTVQMLIESVHADDAQDGYNLWFQVTAVLGPYDVAWQDFFSTLLTQQQVANAINIGVSNTLTLLQSFDAHIPLQALFTASSATCPLPGTAQYPSSTLYPC